LKIGIAFDLAPLERAADGPDDRFEEYDKPRTIEAIAAVLRGEGHEVVLLGDGRALLERVLADPPDLVWNQAEGEGVGRCREARVPAVLEMLGIPYTGSDPLTLAATLDKPVAKRLVAPEGVAVPRGLTLESSLGKAEASSRLARFGAEVGYPLLLKPAFEGSSKGIHARCLVDSAEQASGVFAELAGDYEQPILVEEFIEGDEITVGLVGNGDEFAILTASRIVPLERPDRFVYSVEIKRVWEDKIAFEIPARLSTEVEARLFRSARAAFHALGCRDLARIDYRLRDGIPYFLEANPLPGLVPDFSDLSFIARSLGFGHADLIRLILEAACRRLGLGGHSNVPTRH
jgi:D-alanine-D-alanine ligase